MPKLQDLQERKNKLILDMRTLLDSDTTGSDENYEKMDQELDTIEVAIKREQKLSNIEATMQEVRDVPHVEKPTTNNERTAQDQEKRHVEAFENMLRSNPATNPMTAETRAVLNTLVGSEGGYLVPEVYLTTVIDKLLEMNVMRQNSTVIRTTSTTNIPLGDTRPTFTEILENGAYPDTDASFAQKVLGAKKLGGIIKASDELIADAFINLQSYLSGLISDGIGEVEENRFTVGNGTTQGEGIITGAELGVTTVATAAVTLDEVIDLIYSVKAVYRKNGKLMMNSSTEKVIRKAKDTQGQYLWQPSLQIGVPNTFDGYPIIINEQMPSIGTGNKFMGFGDMKYFQIADRGGMEMKVLPELYAVNGQVGWRVSKRYDSKLIQSETYKYMANA